MCVKTRKPDNFWWGKKKHQAHCVLHINRKLNTKDSEAHSQKSVHTISSKTITPWSHDILFERFCFLSLLEHLRHGLSVHYPPFMTETWILNQECTGKVSYKQKALNVPSSELAPETWSFKWAKLDKYCCCFFFFLFIYCFSIVQWCVWKWLTERMSLLFTVSYQASSLYKQILGRIQGIKINGRSVYVVWVIW